jgi:hypothetical protein
MKRSILVTCTMTVVCFSVLQTVASAQETPGIDGIWIGNVVAADCTSHMPLPGAVPFRALYMFGHDGSLTTEAAFFVPIAPRSSGLGAWRHSQGQTYASKFWFFRYKADGSFLAFREITQTIQLNGDQFTTFDRIEEYDANDVLTFSGCAVSTLHRAQ